MPEQTGPPALDLESVQGMVARATTYAAAAFADGIREPDPARRSAYNLIVYGAPRLLIEARQLRATVARVRALHQQYRTAWTDEFDVCSHCTRGMDLVPWPCDTVRALDGDPTDRAAAGGGRGDADSPGTPAEHQPPPTNDQTGAA